MFFSQLDFSKWILLKIRIVVATSPVETVYCSNGQQIKATSQLSGLSARLGANRCNTSQRLPPTHPPTHPHTRAQVSLSLSRTIV